MEEARFPFPPYQTIDELRSVLDEKLREVLGPTRACGLFGFPDHSNVGDSAIWLGELAFLSAHGIDIVYSCSVKTYRQESLEATLGDSGTLLVSGGGSFGDVWADYHDQVLELLARHRRSRIVIMPQTVYFWDKDYARRTARALANHGDVTLMVRDLRSLRVARDLLETEAVLCPDMALYLSLRATSNADVDVVYLKRADRESRGLEVAAEKLPEVVVADWIGGIRTNMAGRAAHSALTRLNRRLTEMIVSAPGPQLLIERVAASVRNRLAVQRLRVGLELLQQGRVVVTDRLHGHLLTLLLGRPSVALDNNYGKVSSFYQTWTSALPESNWADSPEQAVQLARQLAEGS